MKLYNKILAATFIATGALFTSCSDDDGYQAGAMPEGPEVYFAINNSGSISVVDTETAYSLTVYRKDATETITVPIETTPITESIPQGVFSFPGSVTFNADETSAPFTITVSNPTQLTYDTQYQFLVTINSDEFKTPYGPSSLVVTLTRNAPWNLLGTGTYTDTFWWVNDNSTETDVEVYQNELDPTAFRITNPYTFIDYGDDYFEFYLFKAGDVLFGQTIPSDITQTIVAWNDFVIDFHPNYEEDLYMMFPGRFGGTYQDPHNWVYNYVVDWQDNGLPGEIHLSPYYFLMQQSGGWNNTTSEPISIVFPGYEPIDASVEVTYTGMLNKPDKTLEVMAYVQLGADVEEAKVAVFAGNASDEAIDGIDNGTIESVSINKSETVNIPFDVNSAPGKYTIMAITYYGDEVRSYAYTSFNYGETWSSVGTGLYTYLPFWQQNLGLAPETLELFESDLTPGKYKIENWLGGVDFIFYLEDGNTLYVEEEQPTGVVANGAEVWVDDGTLWGLNGGRLLGGTYTFSVVYYDSDSFNYYTYGNETFVLSTAAQQSVGSRAAVNKFLVNPTPKNINVKTQRKNGLQKTKSFDVANTNMEKMK